MRSFSDHFFLPPDGLAGMRYAGRRSPIAAEPLPSGVLERGQRGADVQRLQQLLNRQTNPSFQLICDGDFGPATERAIRRFQQARHLHVDGQVGRNTWLALLDSVGHLPSVEHQSSASTPTATSTSRTAVPTGSLGEEPPWMAVARAEAGQREDTRPGEHNPRILAYHATTTLHARTDEVAWCASFVNWVLLQVGVGGTNSAAAASWLNWGQASEPRTGAIIVIRNAAAAGSSLTTTGNHVGFLLEETATHYFVLGGNQSNRVRSSSFSKSSWARRGCRWAA